VVVVADVVGWPFLREGFAFLAVYGLLRGIAAVRAVPAWGYAERERDLLVRRGLLIRRLSIVPYGRMPFVAVADRPLARLCVSPATEVHAAAAARDARVPGLRWEEGSRLRDALAALGEDATEGL